MMRHLGVDISTTMKVADVLAALKTNRAKHVELVKEARTGFLEKAKVLLEKKTKEIESGSIKTLSVSLSAPVDNTSAYDTVIGMLEKTSEENITLDASQYRMLVQDEWDWRDTWVNLNSAYSVGTAMLSE